MVHVSTLLTSVVAFSAYAAAAPFQKRIAQVIADSTTAWVAACEAAGGQEKCSAVSQVAFQTLLAAPPPCAQQDAADQMIDLAKTLKSDPTMIALAQIFDQQPRNAPDSLSTLYCQTAPKNAELNGLFICQFEGDNPTTFTGNLKVGAPGTIPFGLSAPVSPPGACSANPKGPIADGTQLQALVGTDPGLESIGSFGGSGGGSSGSDSSASDTDSSSATSTADAAAPTDANASVADTGDSSDASTVTVTVTVTASPAAATATAAAVAEDAAPSAAAAAPVAGAPAFALSNGQKAQQLNAGFASLTADSSCTEGDQGCENGQFAQCVGGKFVSTECAGGLKCFALPLVNKLGTTVTCTSDDDAAARIKATGATGGVTGGSS